jgi:predicted FMN-binding regulatory protein PaiB
MAAMTPEEWFNNLVAAGTATPRAAHILMMVPSEQRFMALINFEVSHANDQARRLSEMVYECSKKCILKG